ncbi:MAG: hypothetical protein ACXABY_33965 [Candidatus Thorarchaeota archaeon]|jgi:hypothetical protein
MLTSMVHECRQCCVCDGSAWIHSGNHHGEDYYCTACASWQPRLWEKIVQECDTCGCEFQMTGKAFMHMKRAAKPPVCAKCYEIVGSV